MRFGKKPDKMRVIVAHPGRQHSHQLALALQSERELAGYWTGVPCAPLKKGFLSARLKSRIERHGPVSIEGSLVRWWPVAPLCRKIGEAVLASQQAKHTEYRGYAWFDWWAARSLGAAQADVVIGYENSALRTFRAARRIGMATVLDAASIHHSAQDRLRVPVESEKLHRAINRQKDEEIRLADHILTVSQFARQTYIDAGVSPHKVHSVMLGADIDLFTPPAGGSAAKSDLTTFLFVGSVTFLKGIDSLLKAFGKVVNGDRRAVLRVVGGAGEAIPYLRKRLSDRVFYLGPLPQTALVEEYQRADCFVLPSRFDSYGMVVAEALACGLPVIVSDMVGAKDLVRENSSGWIVPFDNVSLLEERMFWCVDHRDDLRRMRTAAREAACQASWKSYRERVMGVLHRLFEDRSGRAQAKSV